MVTSAAGVLWQRMASLRWLWVSLVSAAILALLGTDSHFVGDIVAGFYLGLGCAAVVLALSHRFGPRPARRAVAAVGMTVGAGSRSGIL
jgi:predicted PurR-regulated permease PerM